MTLTLQTVEAHVRHALGGDSSVEGNGRSIANQAGRYWASMHDWRCMERLGRLNLRASITINNATWTEGVRMLSGVAPFTNYSSWLQGDEIKITGGTGANTGFYAIQARVSDNAIILQTSIGALADAQSDIDGTITLDTVALPLDFRQLVSRPQAVDSSKLLRMVSMEEINEMRSGGIGTGFDSANYGAILWAPSAAVNGGAPIPVLHIWRAPGSNTTNAFRIHYRADWTDLADDSDVVPIPPAFAMEMLYLQIVRAVALGYEESDMASMQARLATVRGGPEFNDAVRADAMIQTNFGTMRGGAAIGRGSGAYEFTFQPPA